MNPPVIFLLLLLNFGRFHISEEIQNVNDSSESLEESPHARSKRNEDQTRDFFWVFEKIAIIKKHNELRRREKAANMQKMVSGNYCDVTWLRQTLVKIVLVRNTSRLNNKTIPVKKVISLHKTVFKKTPNKQQTTIKQKTILKNPPIFFFQSLTFKHMARYTFRYI